MKFICRILQIFTFVFAGTLYAEENVMGLLNFLEKNQAPDLMQDLNDCFNENISTTCRHSATRYMSEEKGEKFCSNVASNCFNVHLKMLGFYGAREKCLNVASSCFRESIRHLTADHSASDCYNVSNTCYNNKRHSDLSITESIKACKDVSW